MCRKGMEDVDYSFIHYQLQLVFRIIIFFWDKVELAFLAFVFCYLLRNFVPLVENKGAKIFWNCCLLNFFRVAWLERNVWLFKGNLEKRRISFAKECSFELCCRNHFHWFRYLVLHFSFGFGDLQFAEFSYYYNHFSEHLNVTKRIGYFSLCVLVDCLSAGGQLYCTFMSLSNIVFVSYRKTFGWDWVIAAQRLS